MMYYGTCEYCGGVTSANYKSQLKRFCSHRCSNSYKWENIRKRAVTVTIVCPECKKEFKVPKSDHRLKEGKTSLFCSKECGIKNRTKRHTESTCIICGKSFWKGRAKYNLCSEECVNMHRRYLAYKRLYDPNIELSAFLKVYEEDNPFVWAKDKKHYMRQYTKVNRERINWKKLIHKHSDDLVEFKIFMRQRIQSCYKHKRRFPLALQEIVGCTLAQFRKHIASQFQDGMNEANYGAWELDHIVPLNSATSIDEVKELSRYTNYQPLWSEENRRKSDKIIEV